MVYVFFGYRIDSHNQRIQTNPKVGTIGCLTKTKVVH